MPLRRLTLAALLLSTAPAFAQDEGEVIVTAQRMSNSLSSIPAPVNAVGYAPTPPVIGLKRQADSAVRSIEIVSDSREEGMRRREVQAMLLSVLDRAGAARVVLVTGQFELTEVTKANWKDLFPGLAGDSNSGEQEDDDDYDDEDDAAPLAFEDDGSKATIRLKLKTRLDGSIGGAQDTIGRFVKGVPVNGRAQIKQLGSIALTIVNPEQYRDELYRRIAAGAQHALSFYGADYHVEVNGIDRDLAWEQVSNTEIFLYLPYSFSIAK